MGRLRWSVLMTQVWVVMAVVAVGWKDRVDLGVVFALVAVTWAILSHHE